MGLSDEQIIKLLQWYVDKSESYKEWSEKRRKASLENHEWIKPDVIQAMSDEELEKKFLHYYNTDAGYKQGLNKLNRDRIIRDKTKFRETVAYLLNESVGIAERIDEVLDGKYKILGFGRGIVTSMLMDFNVEKYVIWNKKTEMGMNALGIEYKARGDSQGVIYSTILEKLQKLISLMPEANLNSDNIDFFLHVIAAEEEGINKLKEVIGVKSIDHNLLISKLLNEPIDLPLAEWKKRINEPIQDFYDQIDAKIKRTLNFEVKSKKYARGPDSNVKMRTCLTHCRWLYENSNLPSKRKEVNAFVQLGDHTEEKRHQIFWGINWWGIADDADDIYKLFEKLNISGNLTKYSTRGVSAAGTAVMTVMKSVNSQEVSELEIDIYDIISRDLTTALKCVHDILPAHKLAFEKDTSKKNYWWLNANPKIWNFIDTPIGEKQVYTSHNEKGNKRMIFKHFGEVKPGDFIFGYVTSPYKEITALCKVTQSLHQTGEGEGFGFEKIEQYQLPVSFEDLKIVPDLKNCEPLKNIQGSLFRLNENEYEIIRTIIDEKNPIKSIVETEEYKKEIELRNIFVENEKFDEVLNLLEHKKNLVLQGPPGVGKTFLAKHLAFAMLGKKDEDKVQTIQFHQSYSYEDFIQGYRPDEEGGFYLKPGIFFNFCKKALRNQNNKYFFIIDEINRGNLSKIMGELMMLIESDKRGKIELPLTYSKGENETFTVPPNLYLIGTMNTADRSLAMVDYALRRRFCFVDLEPKYGSEKFNDYLGFMGVSPGLIRRINSNLSTLNKLIEEDVPTLGPGFRIGHSYFCTINSVTNPDDSWYQRIVKYEIAPLLHEYWYDSPDKADSRVKILND